MDFGPIVIVVVTVIAIPVGVLVGGGVVAAVLSAALKKNAEVTHEGSELIDLNR